MVVSPPQRRRNGHRAVAVKMVSGAKGASRLQQLGWERAATRHDMSTLKTANASQGSPRSTDGDLCDPGFLFSGRTLLGLPVFGGPSLIESQTPRQLYGTGVLQDAGHFVEEAAGGAGGDPKTLSLQTILQQMHAKWDAVYGGGAVKGGEEASGFGCEAQGTCGSYRVGFIGSATNGTNVVGGSVGERSHLRVSRNYSSLLVHLHALLVPDLTWSGC